MQKPNREADDDFEFVSALGDLENSFSDASEDNRVYPLFDRSLLLDENILDKDVRIMRYDYSVDDLDAVAPGTYCEWTPRSVPASPDRYKKSSSTGTERRWRIRDLIVGRSHSDGKEKFLFMAPTEKHKKGTSTAKKSAADEGKGKAKPSGKKATEVNMATLHRMYYNKAAGGGDRQGRSPLPYKQDFVGILGHGRIQNFH